jgi:glycosyltransferase involved in cell wall biosynthesis
MVKITVILPTYNRPDILPETLSCLHKQTIENESLEILVIDDGGTPVTRSIVQGFSNKFRDIRYLSQEQRGQSSARNLGIKNAHGRLLFFIGDDILLAPDVLEIHEKFHARSSYDRTVLFGNIVLDPRVESDPFVNWLCSGGPQNNFSDLKESGSVPFSKVETAHLSVPREHALGAVFDERLRYYENHVWANMLNQRGFKFHYIKEAVSRHYHPTTLEQYGKRAFETGRTLKFLKNENIDYFVDAAEKFKQVTGKRVFLYWLKMILTLKRSDYYRKKYWHTYLSRKKYLGFCSS